MALSSSIRGGLADHPSAAAFARVVLRVHVRYATEVVARYGLCPFLRDVETGFGAFCVMLDRETDVDRVVTFMREAGRDVGHIVYPLARPEPTLFERFSNAIGERLRADGQAPGGAFRAIDRPVLAAFHPDLIGDATAPHRLVGVLRRAPDPFIQFVPAGLHEGGTILAAVAPPPSSTPWASPAKPIQFPKPPPDPAQANFDKLHGEVLASVFATLADIRADRDASYAPFLLELGR